MLLGRGQGDVFEQGEDGGDTVFVHAHPVTRRELIRAAAVLDGEGLVHEQKGVAGRDPQPEVVILAAGQGLVEQADLIEQGTARHDGGHAHRAEFQAAGKEITALLAVPLLLIEMHAAPVPDLAGVGDLRPVAEHGRGLTGKFAGGKEIVGVEKGDEGITGGPDAAVPGRRHPAVFGMGDDAKRRAVGGEKFGGAVCGTVVHHDQFKGRMVLGKDGIHRPPQKSRPVPGGDHHRHRAGGQVHGQGHGRLNTGGRSIPGNCRP